MKSSKKNSDSRRVDIFLASRLKYLSCGRSWPEFVPRILLLMAVTHLRLCLQHNEHVAAKSSRNVISVRNVVIEQAL